MRPPLVIKLTGQKLVRLGLLRFQSTLKKPYKGVLLTTPGSILTDEVVIGDNIIVVNLDVSGVTLIFT